MASILRFVLSVFVCFISTSQGIAGSAESRVPSNPHFITEDVDRFFVALKAARSSDAPVEVLQSFYLDQASPGLRFYVETARLENASTLWDSAEKFPNQYIAVSDFCERLREELDNFEKIYTFFEKIYGEASTPPVYFVIGHFQGGATAGPDGMVVALDNWAAPWGDFDPNQREFDILSPTEVLTQIIAHELVHYHQRCAANCRTLLAESLHEGGADFLAYLMTGERANHFMTHIYAYYDDHEPEVWAQFQLDMLDEERGVWLYNNDTGSALPENLGYAIGFHIVQAYYRGHPDKDQAIREILTIKDPERFLAQSGYADHVSGSQ